MLEGAELIEDAAKRPNVTLMIIRLLLAQLGTEVIWRADDCVCEVRRLIQHLCNTQIPNLDLVLLGQEHVDSLDVSM